MQILQHGLVAVRLIKIAVILLGADGLAVAQMIVAGHQDALVGQILCQRVIPANKFYHPVGQLQNGPHRPLWNTAEPVQLPPSGVGWQGELLNAAHFSVGASFLRELTAR